MGRGRRLVGALAQAAGQTVSQLAILDAKDTAAQRRLQAQEAKEARLLKKRQGFQSEERIAGESFRAGEGVLKRKSAETIATGKAKASSERAVTKRQQEVSGAIPDFATKLVDRRHIPRDEFNAIVSLAQELALKGEASNETDAINQAKRIIVDEPAARAASSASDIEVPPRGTLAREVTGTTRGEQKQSRRAVKVGDIATRTSITEKGLSTLMQEAKMSRPEALEFIKSKGLSLR